LIIFGPSGIPRGQVVRDTVSLRNLPATVVEQLGFGPESPFPGCTLASYWDPAGTAKRPTDEPILSETSIGARVSDPKSHVPALRGPMRALADGRNVYIHSDKEELYDLDVDPRQSRDLSRSPELRPLLDRFRARLAPYLEAKSHSR